jgi:hypothetical protein
MSVKRFPPAVFVLLVLLLAACGPGGEATDTGGLVIRLAAAPEGYTGSYLTVDVTDAAGEPVTDAAVSLEGNMNHAGMVPVLTEAVLDEADGATDGRYQVPFSFTMMGDWIVTVKVERSDGTTATQNIDVTANEANVTIESQGIDHE